MTDALRALHLLSRVLACEECCPVERALIAEFLETGPRVERCAACGFAKFANTDCPCRRFDVAVHPSFHSRHAEKPPPPPPRIPLRA